MHANDRGFAVGLIFTLMFYRRYKHFICINVKNGGIIKADAEAYVSCAFIYASFKLYSVNAERKQECFARASF